MPRGPAPQAAEAWERDLDGLLAFHGYPKVHWESLCTTNPIESLFATIRHNTRQIRRRISRKTCLAMAFKFAQRAEAGWGRVRKFNQPAKLHGFIPFKGRVLVGQEGKPCAA